MNEETLKRIENKYRVVRTEVKSNASAQTQTEAVNNCHYDHITGNLHSSYILFFANPECYKADLVGLKKYLHMIQNYPEFAKAELSTREGYFPDLDSHTSEQVVRDGYSSGSRHYVTKAYRRLSATRALESLVH